MAYLVDDLQTCAAAAVDHSDGSVKAAVQQGGHGGNETVKTVFNSGDQIT